MNQTQLITVLAAVAPDNADAIAAVIADSLPLREELPSRRRTERAKVDIGGKRIYVEVGFYDDGRPGEVFLKAGKMGTEIRDLFDALATVLSVSMQHGVPLSAFPIKGRGNDLTGEGNELVDTIVKTVEDLCRPAPRSTSSEGSTTSTSSTGST